MFLSPTVLGWRTRGFRWDLCQRGRRRWVHINYPPRNRSTVQMLDESHEKLVFVCNGYIDRLDPRLLPERLRKRLERNRKAALTRFDGKLPWGQAVESAIKRIHTPCLAFAQAHSHHLLEAFSMAEVLEIEKLIPEIREAFKASKAKLAEQEAQDKFTRHVSVDLVDLKEDPVSFPFTLKQR
ncbi:hypothetical protein TGPRC2_263680 [Toxoplasma gondii TgCatPRC2]|uniref:Uncharacterized protein n=4 Tax=Toxoplasma gondii TaxID=5811 RepID=A0A151HNB0_TOXGO|nr:hypothetical protein TGME49_263680 [Toxoplasma gondii ME49]EPT29769.1 hypothetical protein TGME49_263680 [Toxoplasma gondii ME49]KYF40823.1 hypothetical protein TGARI_263680 [Toxoplasma gondii ARI]KYK70741.1 hypothetical protein TGPRC2_263680 [Toxoplasma gondii TgCatPRC2]|eukprot:XP_002365468.1 hypothetical protein TGME49_263680 [Toxoplasma gondii ME49]